MKKFIFLSLLILLGAGCTPTPSNNGSQENSGSPSEESTTPTAPASERINLSGQGLTAFPMDVLEKTNVVDLDISNNAIGSAMPAEIRHLSKLISLNASGNQMTGVPAEIGQLSNLENLNLSDNQLTGLPNELANLTNLKILNLRGNDISTQDLEIIRASLLTTKIFVD